MQNFAQTDTKLRSNEVDREDKGDKGDKEDKGEKVLCPNPTPYEFRFASSNLTEFTLMNFSQNGECRRTKLIMAKAKSSIINLRFSSSFLRVSAISI